MKKFLYGILAIVFLALLAVFHRDILQTLNKLEPVKHITSHVMGIEPADTSVADMGSSYYAYGTLTDTEKMVYNQMADCLLNFREETTISTKAEKEADKAFQSLISDHPEIFWTSAYELVTYHLSGMNSEFVFRPQYDMTQEESQQLQEQIDTVVFECLEGLPARADTYTTAKYLFEYIILNTEYNKEAANNQNICSVFLENESVCMGYSKAYQYLLQKCGIEAVVVSGESENEAHAWNLVKLDGDYYYVDVTWGDPEFSAAEEIGTKYMDYSFFCMTTYDLLKTHSFHNVFSLPECTAIEYNYFRHEGLYLSTFQETAVDAMIQNHFAANPFISIRCSNSVVYQKLYNYLIENGEISKFIDGNKVSYVENKVYDTLGIFR
ncbi:MAG: hypothetical protein HFI75_13670 [Lachnospiraceae bacterium]|nr:hypothetical protein [Lachnospiraceae bacterium]